MKQHLALLVHAFVALSVAVGALVSGPTSHHNEPILDGESIRVVGSESFSEHVSSASRQYSSSAKPSITVTTSDSSDGLAKLFAGQADVALTSRPLLRAEIERANELRKPLRSVILGFDGISIVVHPSIGRDLKGLDLETLRKIFVDGSIKEWDQVLPGTQGSIRPILPPVDSGTTTTFLGFVGSQKSEIAETVEIAHRMNDISKTVANDRFSIGLLASGILADGLTTIPVRNADGDFVRCSESTLRRGSYPLARKLFAVATLKDRQQATRFLSYLASVKGQEALYSAGLVTSLVVDVPKHANATMEDTVHAKKPSGH